MRTIWVVPCCAVMFSACESGTTNGTHAVADVALMRSSNEAGTQDGQDVPSTDLPSGTSMNADATSVPQSSAIRETPLDDGKILQILHTLNQRETETAQLALRRAIDVRVVSFAKVMIAERTDAERKSTKLAVDEKITSTDSAIGDRLATDGKQTVERLTTVLDSDFDKTYSDAIVKEQRDVLVLLREQLLAKATDPKLKKLVGEAIPKVQHDYEDAKRLSKTDSQLAIPN